jgi:formylglycine-generating enzyme required for sulfatase activity
MRQGIHRNVQRIAAAVMLAGVLSATPITTAFADDAPANARAFHDVTCIETGGTPLMMDIYVPAAAGGHPTGAVLHLMPARHVLDSVDAALLNRGIAVAVVGYGPGGAEPKAEIAVGAVQGAVRFIHDHAASYGINPNALSVMGKDNAATVGALAELIAAADATKRDARVCAIIMLAGTPDLTNAEANGDESVNEQTGPAYVLFHHNVKERPDKAIAWSPSTWVDTNSPAILSVCGALDHRMPWYAKWIVALQACGVPAQQITQPGIFYDLNSNAVGDAIGGWCATTLATAPHDPTESASARVARLDAAGLHDAAARLANSSFDAAALATFNQQRETARLTEARSAFSEAVADNRIDDAEASLWQIRLRDDALRLQLQPTLDALSQQVNLLLQGAAQKQAINQLLNNDPAAAARSIRELQPGGTLAAATGPNGESLLTDFAGYSHAVRTSTVPPGVHTYPWAQSYGVDLYGYWMDVRIAGTNTQRFRYVPPGIFVMGVSAAAPDRLPDEPIARRVRIDRGLWVADTLVTQAMYDAKVGSELDQSYFRGPNLPVDSVSYAHANNFARSLGIGARLPSESEYEYACRGPEGSSPTPTGRLSDSAWYWDKQSDQGRAGATPVLPELVDDLAVKPTRMTHRVAAKLPNAFGLYDMQGNVWEWCIENAGTAPHDYHPAHGGAWTAAAETCRPSRRQLFYVEDVPWNVGFRIVIPAE